MPYAIIRAGGHQEKVSPGEQITIDHVRKEVGETITFTPLMIQTDESVVTDRGALASASVVGTILQHLKGDKVDVFQYRQKTGYRRHTGHRQPLTLVEISEIRLGEQVFTALPPEEAKAEEPEAAAEEEKPARRKGPARKAAAKPKAAKKAPGKKAPGKKAPAKKK